MNITSESQLETEHFIFKDREDENRFDSEDQLVKYQINEAKSELISILLKENDLSKSKEKLLKRLANRKRLLIEYRMTIFSVCMLIVLQVFMIHTQITLLQKVRRF